VAERRWAVIIADVPFLEIGAVQFILFTFTVVAIVVTMNLVKRYK
jgi:hypothetical protein